MLVRHSRTAIFLHWFNAVCWIFLLFSGLAILSEHLQPGSWNRDFWHGLFGPLGLLNAHILVGCVWVGVYSVSLLLAGKSVFLPFIRRICRFSPARDCLWCGKKALWLTLGPTTMRKMGISPDLPPQGFYNAGQRIVAVLAIICGVGLGISGIMLAFFSGSSSFPLSAGMLEWTILLHFCFAGVMAIFLPIHIYMAALAPGEGPALRSMFTGKIPKEHVRHHNPLWHAEISKLEKAE